MSTIEQRVRSVISERLRVKEEAVTRNASIMDDLGADSLATVELIVEVSALVPLSSADVGEPVD